MNTVRIGDATVLNCDVFEGIRSLPDESVHCVVTSPPYWRLRDYGVDGQIGLEPTPEAFVSRMVKVFREVRRVLRKDGTCWINLGDSYANGGRGDGAESSKQKTNVGSLGFGPIRHAPAGLKPKDLVGIPWRVAFALQADGWYLRSDIIWAKPNPMPESVTDRPTKAHEYLFLLTKSPRYYYDAEAIRETAIFDGVTKRATSPSAKNGQGEHRETAAGFTDHDVTISGRNRRTVWTIATEPFPGAHFATFPQKLVEPCILAGCPEKCCPKCGAPWIIKSEIPYDDDHPTYNEWRKAHGLGKFPDGLRGQMGTEFDRRGYGGTISAYYVAIWNGKTPEKITIGPEPSCSCGLNPVPGVVLDPFAGSGTALIVALKNRRRGTGIELSPEYFDMSCNRLRYGTVIEDEIRAEAAQGLLFKEPPCD